jgi:putative ABC transport system permease protein
LLTVFDQSADKDATIASVNSVLSSSGIIFAVQKDQMYGYYIVKEDLAQAEDFAGVMAFMILFAAFFVIYSHFSRTVEEQKKQIGVMRALGYSRGAVMGSYIYMALVIGLVGAISGVIAGYPIGAAFGDFYVSVVIGGGQSNFEVSAEMAITGFLFGPVTAILACAVAVWGTVSMDPYDAMRDMRTQKQRKRRARTSPRPHITHVSYITLYTLRNMFRRKRRTLFTIVAVAFAIVIGGMAFPMIGSFTNSMDSAITEREHWDIIVDYSYPLDYGTAEGIAGADVVDAVQVAKASGVWHFGEHAGSELVMSLEEGQTLHDYSLIDGTVFDGVDQIMVGYAFNKEYAAQVGDVITLEVVGGTRELTVSAVLGDLTGGFFVHEQVMDELLDGIVYSGSYVKCAPGKVESVSSALLENPLVANVELRSELQSGIIDLMESYNSLLYSFSLVGVGIATVTIANMVFMGILERYKEYGQLRAIGYSKRDTSKSIVTEISLTILISAVVSIPLLFILLESFVETFKNFWPVYRTMVHPEDMLGYGFVILLTLGFGLLAAVPAIRYLNRMDLAKTVAGSRFG